MSAPSPRLVTLDFVRGVAVLGILLLNVVGFSWPEIGYVSPRAPGGPRGAWDEVVYLAILVLADGKFRGLFSLLFGASLLLLIERAEARGLDGRALQRRRLWWLALFGLAHFFLLWWGDILFLYAVCGAVVLKLSHWPARRMVRVALVLYAGGALALGALTALPVTDAAAGAQIQRAYAAEAAEETRVHRGPWLDKTVHQLREQWFAPLVAVALTGLETIPLMLLGMALLKSGFFAEAWDRGRLRRWAAAAIGGGLVLTIPIAAWLWREGFPLGLMLFAWLSPAAFGRLAMVVGYAALTVLAARAFAASGLGERLVAAGRMAFSNYLGTSMVMAGLFHGWGLGLYARYSRLELLAFVLLGWVLMLAWSKPWLAHFRQGPLEWLWRSLVSGRREPFRIKKTIANEIDSH